MKKGASIFLIACLGGFISIGTYKVFEKENTSPTAKKIETKVVESSQPIRYVNMPAGAPEGTVNFTYAAEMTVNSVVHVKTQYESKGSGDPLYDYFWGRGGSGVAKASGSGVIISDDGFIVTNNHVIKEADKIQVTLNNKKTYTAKVIGADPATDLALLKISATDLPAINFANSDDVKVGEWVLAVGNPFNLTSTVTAGIVSAKARSINILEYDPDRQIFPLESFIQTDAAVNPGNSGGALVSSNGDLVGINTAIASNTGSYAGYSFAVPVNIVKKVTNDLLEYGTVQRAFIGVSIRDLDQELADELKVKDIEGVYVSGLTAGGAASDAGIKEGDIIMKIGSVDVNNVPALQEQVGKFRPGDKIAVTVKRSGSEKILDVTLRNKDGNTKVITKPKKPKMLSSLGASFENVTTKELKELKISSGVKVTDLTGGKLRSAGIKEGFIITKIDQDEVHSPEEAIEILKNKTGGVLVEGVYPNGMKGFYGFGM
jgi:serine protease Do